MTVRQPMSDTNLSRFDFPALSETENVHWRIADEQAGRRLDNALLTRLPLPRSALYRLIRRGRIRVNGRKVSPDYRLSVGDELRLPPMTPAAEKPTNYNPDEKTRRQVRSWLIDSGDGFLVLDKPPGVAVQRGSLVRVSVLDMVRAAFTEHPTVDLVHRLDKDTSGCLVLATSLAFARHFQRQLKDSQVHKEYLCLVKGRVRPGRMEDMLAPPSGRRDGPQRWSSTSVRVLRRFSDATLVRAEPSTGRKHQLRLQFARRDSPIAGDSRYGDPDFNAWLRKLGLKRMFLHANRLAFAGLGGDLERFETPLDAQLKTLLTRL